MLWPQTSAKECLDTGTSSFHLLNQLTMKGWKGFDEPVPVLTGKGSDQEGAVDIGG